jgi:hypothetical protein
MGRLNALEWVFSCWGTFSIGQKTIQFFLKIDYVHGRTRPKKAYIQLREKIEYELQRLVSPIVNFQKKLNIRYFWLFSFFCFFDKIEWGRPIWGVTPHPQ